ncbi:MAG: potassium transporter KtrB [Salinisphaeraceae bacterium]|nr:potassium transporter KtrB [Salinisphaeraceae bacterium]
MRRARRRFAALIRDRRPVTLLVAGYSLYVLAGFILLCLPVSQATPGTALLDHLFIATSAVSTTGLVTISPAGSYSFFGELVIISLIQLGGIGYMTLGSFMMLAIRHRLDGLHENVARTVFVLPSGMNLARFIRSVVLFTVTVESLGAIYLSHAFAQAGIDAPIWHGIFHAISAFCTAGFSLFDNSLEDFRGHLGVNVVVAALSYLGAIGFIVMSDWWRWLTQHKRLSLTSRVILKVTLLLAAAGTILLALTDPQLQALGRGERLLTAFFQTMTAMTTVGFNTYPIAGLGAASILLVIVAMVMGASPSGTGGGVKSTTVATFFGAIASAFRGDSWVILSGEVVREERVLMAMATLGFYLLSLTVGAFLLLLTETGDFAALVFEAASALGTVGLSMGATADLSDAGKWIILVMMFIGRLGPITAGIALFPPPSDAGRYRKPPRDLAV